MRAWQWIVVGAVAAAVAACGGGSGSTGLVTSESSVVDDVRTNGTCDEFDGVSYCGTDSPNAVAPGGESVSIVSDAPTPARTATPAAAPTPTGAPGESPTPTDGGPNPSPTAAQPTPASSATPAAPVPTASPAVAASVTVVLDGFDAGAACAAAARPLGSDAAWRTAALVPVATGGAPTTFPLPQAVAAPRDLALLCYDAPPSTVPTELASLADGAPTVVFVLPSP